ncbi:hypothetical protein HAX54_030099, partial [Datura stramonium]|nr:hypothetical protein [Datura stramonium]
MVDESRVSDAGSLIIALTNHLIIKLRIQKKRKDMQPRSEVWDHFDKIVENGIGKPKCKYYKQNYAASSSKNGTTRFDTTFYKVQ